MKRSAYIFFSVTFLLTAATLTGSYAQKKKWDKMREVVYLHNGSQIVGKILSEDSGEVEIQTADGSIWVFPQSEVHKTSMFLPQEMELPKETTPNLPRQGVFFSAEVGSLSGSHHSTNPWDPAQRVAESSFTAQLFLGYRHSPHFSWGVTSGIDGYSVMAAVPLGVGVKGDFAKSTVTPFYQFMAGHAFTVQGMNNDFGYKGGYFLNPALGMKYKMPSNLQIFFTVGYRTQRLTAKYPTQGWGWQPTVGSFENRYSFNRLMFTFGIGI